MLAGFCKVFSVLTEKIIPTVQLYLLCLLSFIVQAKNKHNIYTTVL